MATVCKTCGTSHVFVCKTYDGSCCECEIKRLREEIAWCHEGLTAAHERINPDIPAPDWATVYASLEAADAEGESDGS